MPSTLLSPFWSCTHFHFICVYSLGLRFGPCNHSLTISSLPHLHLLQQPPSQLSFLYKPLPASSPYPSLSSIFRTCISSTYHCNLRSFCCYALKERLGKEKGQRGGEKNGFRGRVDQEVRTETAQVYTRVMRVRGESRVGPLGW